MSLARSSSFCLLGWILLAGCGGGAPDAVVLVVVDTLRADHVGLYGYDRPTTPHIDRRGERAAVFENAFATSSWTLASMGSLFTGRLPERHGAGFKFGPDRISSLIDGTPTLAEVLAGQGYATGAVITNINLGPRFGLPRGFATFHDLAGDEVEPPATADVAVDRALQWIGEQQGRFFLFLHLLDPHLPYGAPEPDGGRFTAGYAGPLALPFDELHGVRTGHLALEPADREFIAAAYDEEIAFVDRQVGRLFDALEARRTFDRGLVVLTADHGEELFEHGGFEHGHSMYQEVLHVPLLVWGRGVVAGRRAEPVSLVDLLPTLADATGAEPVAAVEGASLWPLLTGVGPPPPPRQLAAQWCIYGPQRRAIVEWPFKVLHDPRRKHARLYDLSVDPGERHDLGRRQQQLLGRLLSDLDTLLPTNRPGGPSPEALDPRTEQQLHALGYVQ